MTTRAPAAETVGADRYQLLQNGDRLDQKTFHALYEQCEPGFRAELILGEVHLPSPTSGRHGGPHARLIQWLLNYTEETDGVEGFDNTSLILTEDSEPQPDGQLRIRPESGGQTSDDTEGYIHGACELAAEVANATVSIDLNRKRTMYELAGVREYLVWVVAQKRVVWFVRRGAKFVELQPDADGLLKSRTFPGLWLDPAAVFDRTSRRLTAALRLGLATPEHAAFVAKLEAKAARRRSKSAPPPEAP